MGFSRRAKSKDSKPAQKKKKFPPTPEQLECFNLTKIAKVCKFDAGAGTGKTATLEYCADNTNEKILYLAYNKTMADEASERFPHNVMCMTTHSLAYRAVGRNYQGKLSRPRSGGYVNCAVTPKEISVYFKLPDLQVNENEFLTKTFLAMIVRDTVDTFEYSSHKKINEHCIPRKHKMDVIKRFPTLPIERLEQMVVRYANQLWDERKDVMSPVLARHDTYLKLYELRKPDLSQYDVIFLDEAQDANDCTLSIVKQQMKHCKVVFVGDVDQQIYAWRGSVNALEKVDAPSRSLTKSFRFGEKVAQIANAILETHKLKGFEDKPTKVSFNRGVIDQDKPYTILFRTNMELIFTAVEMLTDGEDVNVSFDTKDFVSVLTSTRALYENDLRNVKHESIIPYATWDDLKEEAKEMREYSRLVTLIEEGQDTKVIETLHSYKKTGKEKITLMTAHRSKGLEFDQVILADDFPSNYNSQGEWVGITIEEKRLLYVAATRGMKALQYNWTVKEFLESQNVQMEDDCPDEISNAPELKPKYVDPDQEEDVRKEFKKVVSKEIGEVGKLLGADARKILGV